ncbi:MAG: V-type ATPase 116kDa subunit family protein [Lachnospiraceae bacterium]|nr:V-type ATPase 116kDa subunit family protein [Lachnospiraceae bacterium]
MIVKMKFLSLTGPKADIDRVVNKYLSKYEIHLENALSELQSVSNLSPYIQINPYKELLGKAEEFSELIGQDVPVTPEEISLEDSIDLITDLDKELTQIDNKRSDLEAERTKLSESMTTIQPFREIHYNLSSILDFHFIRFRFGKIPREYFKKFDNYIYENFDTVFYQCDADEEYVWGVYFVPNSEVRKVDAVYSSMHFQRIYIPDDYTGTPDEAYAHLENRFKDINDQVEACKTTMQKKLQTVAPKLLGAREKLESLSQNFDVRKVAACTKADLDTFYILCGWMTESDVKKFQADISEDDRVYCLIEQDQQKLLSSPPTKLKNPKLFKPFEMFTRMYGLPAYNELDPTMFVALTYAFIFGCMFGDAGQGLCLLIGGALLYKFKKIDLAGIICAAGFFSTIFGFMFGSLFGFEDILPAIWLRPLEAMMDLPFFGRLNAVFVFAIAFGMFLILVAMIFHIINGKKAGDIENVWFDTNGVAGLVFYGSLVAVIVLFMTGNALPATIVLVIMFVIPLLLIFCKEPITKMIKKESNLMPDGKAMFFVQGFFELFEVLLSYFSNTLSFVRIGAFAVSHAAMMEVVLQLAGAADGSPNWIVIVLGNIFVMGMEGLVVGIQVLRLEYYEMFSRFYKGTGKPFQPFLKKKTAK